MLHRRHRWRRRSASSLRFLWVGRSRMRRGSRAEAAPAIIGAGVPADVAAPDAAAWPATGALAAAGGVADPEAEAGVTFVAAGGGAGA